MNYTMQEGYLFSKWPIFWLWYRDNVRYWGYDLQSMVRFNNINPCFGQNFDFFRVIGYKRTSLTPRSLNISAQRVKSPHQRRSLTGG